MLGLDFQDIVQKIVEEKNLQEDDVKSRIRDKLTKLSGLISNEGAAHIVANELGVDLFDIVRKKGLKIQKITAGMRGVGAVGKVIRVFGIHTFQKEGREGKVGSFQIGDETGVLRVVVWDTRQLQFLEQGIVKEGTIVKVTNGYVRSNNGYKEMHLTGLSEIVPNPPGIEVGTIHSGDDQTFTRKMIQEIREGDYVGVAGTIVQAFEPRFYPACPTCGKKLNNGCQEHGDVEVKHQPVFNIVLDDGTGNVRCVAFRDVAHSLLDIDDVKMQELRNNPALFDAMKRDVLGKQILAVGRVNKNEMFDRLEMVIQKLPHLDPQALAQELLKGMHT